ncbi:MAG: crotonase [Gammaproteobacteria bacterium HGW-Gammaproteobacteria-11]|nr:MAG: crotonase [Gammaproteobacteria bacterium HGW-Gammaproteobacteria-11]
MTDPSIIVDVRNHIGHLILNRPAGLNALNIDMIRQLQQQLDQWANDDQVRAVILRGAGERAFCAGGDIRTLYDLHLAGDSASVMAFFTEEYALDQYLHTYPKPVVALMDGFVLGGGMGLAQAAKLRIITERSRLGMPETGIGYFPDVGGSYFLPRLPGELGTYLGLTGNHLTSADALYAGLADHCLPSEQIVLLDQQLDNLDWDQQSLEQVLRDMPAKALPSGELKALQGVIDQHFQHRTLAEICQSLREESDPSYRDWAASTLALLQKRSPLALAVTLELLRRGRQSTLSECFAMELHLDRQWFAEGDIVEGVRALLVDKDKQPRWNPAQIDQLDPARVAGFFEGL